MQLVYKETILVGHSLENDLLALKISHSLVIDTAVLYKHSRGGTYKIALRVLTRRFLSREIQDSGNGHDSIEDAKAAMDLAFLKIKHGKSLVCFVLSMINFFVKSFLSFKLFKLIFPPNFFCLKTKHGNWLVHLYDLESYLVPGYTFWWMTICVWFYMLNKLYIWAYVPRIWCFFETGPDFGRPPSFTRKKFLTVLGDSGKASSFIDNISIVKRYASESSHSIPVASDDEALLKTIKEVVSYPYSRCRLWPTKTYMFGPVSGLRICHLYYLSLFISLLLPNNSTINLWPQVKNDRVHFVWAQFTELGSYYKKQAEDTDALNKKLAEMIALLTCNNKSKGRKSIKYTVTPDLKDVLSRLNSRIKNIYSSLPSNVMLIVCSGHGDTAVVQR